MTPCSVGHSLGPLVDQTNHQNEQILSSRDIFCSKFGGEHKFEHENFLRMILIYFFTPLVA